MSGTFTDGPLDPVPEDDRGGSTPLEGEHDHPDLVLTFRTGARFIATVSDDGDVITGTATATGTTLTLRRR